MKRTTKVICHHETGPPVEVARVETWDLPAMQPHQVLVEMKAAPINPADLNVLEGKYPVSAPLPRVVGNEGVGVVVECGSEVKGIRVGDLVIAPVQTGSWCEARVLDGNRVFVVPPDIPIDQACMVAVNPPTAWRMLHDFVELQRDDWIVQNVANSGVGRAVIAIARAKGWRTVNVVRRTELIEELTRVGADVVVTDETPLARQIRELTGGAEIKLALNAVGGESARDLAKSLSLSGTLVTYGAMGREPLRIDNALLIFKDIRFRGFWVSEWYRRASRNEIEAMLGPLVTMIRDGSICAPVERTFPLDSAREAIFRAQESGRNGKVLFRVGSDLPS